MERRVVRVHGHEPPLAVDVPFPLTMRAVLRLEPEASGSQDRLDLSDTELWVAPTQALRGRGRAHRNERNEVGVDQAAGHRLTALRRARKSSPQICESPEESRAQRSTSK